MTITNNGTTTFDVQPGGEYVFSAAGTFGGGTLSLKFHDGTNAVTIKSPSGDIALTAADAFVLVAPTSRIDIVLAGATTPSIIANLLQISSRGA